MSEDDGELTDWTLGAVKASGMVLEGACATPGCNEFARFEIDGLIEGFGVDWRVPQTLPVRCSACGAWLKFQLAVLHDDKPES
ncbi:MAG: hypothetical protein ACT4OU_12265 [Hyphomicrobium sp.]